MRGKLLGILAAGVIAGGLGISSPAHAGTGPRPQAFPGGAAAAAVSFPEICGNAGYGYCMNDWNGGAGAAVKMYYGHNSNEHFQVEAVSLACGHGRVTLTCPFTGGNSWMNSRFLDDQIWVIYYPDHNQCVGDNGFGGGYLTTCPDLSGQGGGNGVIGIVENDFTTGGNTGCNQGNQFYFIDRYASANHGTPYTLDSGGNPGVQTKFDPYTNNSTCWGWISS